jgi:hypothetical protein
MVGIHYAFSYMCYIYNFMYVHVLNIFYDANGIYLFNLMHITIGHKKTQKGRDLSLSERDFTGLSCARNFLR